MKNLLRWSRCLAIHIFMLFLPKLHLPKKIAILAPHPDDEIMGCAGLIQKAISQGCEVNVIFMTSGEASLTQFVDISPFDIKKARRKLAVMADSMLRIPESHLYFLNYNDGAISEGDEETKKLQELLNRLKPDAVFVPHIGEGWNDHIATRMIGERVCPEDTELYEYCVWFWYYNSKLTNIKQLRKVTLSSSEHKLKTQAIDCYTNALAQNGQPWSGNLPSMFVSANKFGSELFVRLK